jgi:hypothetical protein
VRTRNRPGASSCRFPSALPSTDQLSVGELDARSVYLAYRGRLCILIHGMPRHPPPTVQLNLCTARRSPLRASAG